MSTLTARLSEWHEALPHRSAAELEQTAARLEQQGLTPERVRRTLTCAGDDLVRQQTGSVEGTDIAVAVLVVELSAYISYAQARTAALRREVFGELLRSMSLAQLAQVLGVSRQAVHKSVAADGRPVGDFASALTEGA